MRKGEKIETKTNVIPMSKATEKRLSKVLDEINGKKLFSEKIEFAKKTLQNVKLPM
ncbi:hypothetical protein [Flavobacterium sp. N1736]|uniref:hypothetical protein n=1 Tax=Flavobacterium sp. N1736 TaxID=2986823 RepID=UPI002225293D|nr:hypothetical protein [Flavobacterium sp. N1736]